MRHAAHTRAVRALDHEQPERPFALQLQRHARPRLDSAREQHRRGDAFSEQSTHLRRVTVLGDYLAPRLLEPDHRAADTAAFEDESLHFVHVSDSTTRTVEVKDAVRRAVVRDDGMTERIASSPPHSAASLLCP